MKECPLCHATYPDSQNFCVNDGRRLVEAKESQAAENKPHAEEVHQKPGRANVNKPAGNGGAQAPHRGGIAKKVLTVAAILVIVGIAVFNHVKNAATYLRTEPQQASFSKGGGTEHVDIDYDGHIWKVNYAPSWVSVSKDGNSLSIEAAPNVDGETREGSVTIKSGRLLAEVRVTQSAYATYIRPGLLSLSFSKSGGIQGFEIHTDGAGWSAYCPDWLTLTASDCEMLRVDCPENDGEYRTGMITLKEDYAQASISVTQGGICDNCHGKGTVPCSACMGLGGFGYGIYRTPCSFCGGTGSVQCGFCSGSGERE